MKNSWAIVDCETTGVHIKHDHLTEIAVLLVNEEGTEQHFHHLIKPPCLIPAMIERLTGIRNEMVVDAPSFAEVAYDLRAILEGVVFVAHNARFDYSFLKNHFKQLNISFSPTILCTLKLFKKLYPGLASYALKELALHFGYGIEGLHRAQADVKLLQKLLWHAEKEKGDLFFEEVKKCIQKASIPSKLKTDISTIPESPGVYLFYGAKNNLPLYIGKSISLRTRVLSHFQADYTSSKEFSMAQQVERVEFIPTAGELSALLLESELIKKHMPLHNRRLRRQKKMMGFQLRSKEDYLHVDIVSQPEEGAFDIFGSYRSVSAAKKALLALVKEHQLCPKLCGLEHSNSCCFSYQLKRCKGACIQKEAPEHYNLRVHQAFENLKVGQWPFDGPLIVKEVCDVNQLTRFLKFDQWRYLGAAASESELADLDKVSQEQDWDSYKILLSYIKNNELFMKNYCNR